jgi:ssDNA-binding Zn-finger/Zn-ribbon topoisomerase 1
MTAVPASDPLHPVCDGSHNGSPQPTRPTQPTETIPSRTCPVCTVPLTSTRARYCSAACRQHAFRLRHQRRLEHPDERHLREDLRRRRRLAAQTVYECPLCGERFVGEQRCPECNRFCRALGVGGHCPDCAQPILVAEVLAPDLSGTEVRR